MYSVKFASQIPQNERLSICCQPDTEPYKTLHTFNNKVIYCALQTPILINTFQNHFHPS
jgi:hypothetical protein